MNRGGLSPRKASVVLAGFWMFGIALLVGSLFGSVGVDHLRDAPTCAPIQTFTSDYCRITVDATLTKLTSDEVTMTVGDRPVTTEVALHGPLTDNVAGLPARVTFYEGLVVHIEDGDMDFDTSAAPEDSVTFFRFAGLGIMIFGTFVVGIPLLGRLVRGADSPTRR